MQCNPNGPTTEGERLDLARHHSWSHGWRRDDGQPFESAPEVVLLAANAEELRVTTTLSSDELEAWVHLTAAEVETAAAATRLEVVSGEQLLLAHRLFVASH